MISYIRLLICILGVTLLSPALSQAQQLSVTSITPNPVCASSSITVSYSYTNTAGDAGILYMYLNGPGTSNVLIAAVAVSGNNGSIQGTIPADRTTGTYTVQLIRQSTSTGSVVAGPPASSGFTVNALPSAPGVSNVAYCQGATGIPPLTANGQNLIWYPASTGGGGTTVAPTPPTSTTGTTDYYVSQTINGCEGPRANLKVTINPPPAKPTVVSSLSYCQGVTAPSLAGAVSSGSNLKWYSSIIGGVGSTVAPVPSTSDQGSITYYVSQTNFSGQTDGSGCESDRSAITVTTKAAPAAPTVTSPVTYCQDAVATPLSATGVGGGTLNWYGPSNNSLGSTAPTPPTTAPGTTFYSVSQTVNGCEGTKATIQVTINTRPAAPTTTPVSVCQNTTPVSLATGITSGSNLRWYTSSSGGVGSTVAPSPSTTTIGSTPYYVSQVDGNGCESDRAVLTFIVNGYPSAPSVTNPAPYCQNAPATSLTASATPSPGGTLNFYLEANGGTRYADLSPSTTASNNYYVSQTVNGCESTTRATISVTVNALPPAPAVTTPITYCQFTVAAPLSATALTNNTLYWYGTNPGGTGSTVTPTPSTNNNGSFIYYVSQKDPIGCESSKVQINVTINEKPAAPTVTPASACLNSVPNPLTSSVTATGTLTWYTASSGGTGSTVAPTLSTSATGSTTYYVTQTSGSGCESDRAAITFTVNPLPSAPTVASPSIFYCQNATAAPLTATGTNLKWYSTNTGGTALPNPVIPLTTVAGSTVYYVSQTDGNGCESSRTPLAVVIGSLPVPPTVSTTPVVYCQYDTPVSLSATALSGNTLLWYGPNETGGTASTGSGFTVPTTDPFGSTRYYVSQKDGNGCESSTRAFITVTVNPKPAAPTTTSLTLCQNASTVSLQTAVTAGTNLKWYNAQTGGTMYTGTPVISTSAVGSTTYYVSQTSGEGCESDRSAVVVTVKPLPVAPTVTPNPPLLCQSSVPTPLTAIATGSLRWYDAGGNVYTSITPSTNAVGPTSYSVSQVVDGCEGPKAALNVVVIAKPVAPTVEGSIAVCQLSTPTALTAAGTNLKWYTVSMGGTPSTVAPVPPTDNAGTTPYYVTQTDANGCESDRATISVRIKPKPNPPGVTTPISFCSNQVTALVATFDAGTTPNWYGTNPGGTPTTTAPVPATDVIGAPVNYYVSQTLEGCESDKAVIAVTIKALPLAPTVSSTPVLYCQDATAAPLSATAATGGTLNWYTASTGGSASATAPIPPTTPGTPLTTYYYVSQTVDGCEGPRATIAVTVNPKPINPTVVASLSYCQNTTAPILSATAAGTLKWYADATTTTTIPTPTPSTTTPGQTSYYVTQTDVNGCESDRASITVTVIATPTAPVTSTATFCQNATPIALTATASPGGTLNWYTLSVGGTPTASAPFPPTSATGTTTYYVSQSISGCEGPRASLDVIVLPLPTAPTVSTSLVSYCQNAVSVPLVATASTGGTLNWYTVSTGGTPSSVTPTPSTSAVGSMTYYVSQSVNGCEGPRAGITVTIKSLPTAPVVNPTVNSCQNTAPITLTATASSGGTLYWYTAPTGGTPSSTAPLIATNQTGITVYYVSQLVDGCESPRASITVTITATPGAPGTLPVSYCVNATSTSLTAVASLDGTLNWYSNQTGGVSTPFAPSPPTSTAGVLTYYVSQSVNGCEGPRASVTVTIKSLPGAPGLSASALSYCQNETSAPLTAIPSSGGTLNWYTVPVNGTPSQTAPTPPTSTVGLQQYYVSQTVNGCEGDRVYIAVTIKARPTAPGVVTAPLVYCQGVTAPALTASPASGGTLNWYTTQTGGVASAIAPIPPTTAPGFFTYYVSQTVNGCEGPMASITVLVQPTPPAPTVGAAPIYCQGGTSTALSAVATSGGTLSWYTTPTGGTASAIPPVPPVTTVGTVTYYVSQNVNGCEGPRVSLTATIKAAPGVPAVASSPAYCQGVVAAPLTATPNGGVLNWYTTSAGGNSSSIAPVPPTNVPGTLVYYVSQTDANGCESNRAPVTVKINPLPVAPSTTPATYCQGSVATALVATPGSGGTLNWYTTPTGGTSSSLAPTPVTANSGVLPYYVSQTDINGCESTRSILLVTVTALPAAPVFPAVAPVCQNSTPFVLVAAGQNLKWYADATTTASLGSAVTQTTTIPGTFVYYVSQTVNSCESPRATAQVVVNALPAPPVVAANQNGCQDAIVQPLTATGTALQWYDGNDNLISPPTPVTKVDITQSYNYKVTQTINGCTSPKATFTYVVNVTPLPTVVSPIAYCQNAIPKPLTATGTNLKWTDPTGAVTTNAPTPPTTVVTTGTSYSVTQTSALGCESRKAEIKVAVNSLSAAKLEGTSSIYLGSSAVLTLTLSGVGPYSYTLSDGTTGTAETAANGEATVRKISVTPAASTTYAVTAVTNACGNGIITGGATVTVRVPTITTTALSTATVCTGVSFVVPFSTTGEFVSGNAFTVEIASATGDSASRKYTPISNGVIQGAGISTSIPTTFAAGQYYVRVSALNAPYPILGTRSPTLLTVRAAPTASISASRDVIFNGQSTQLNFALTGDSPWTVTYGYGAQVAAFGTASNVFSVTVTPTTTTTYKLLTVSNVCGSGKTEGVDTVRVRVDVLTAEEDLLSNSVKVYPVPTDGAVTVDIDLPLQKDSAKLQLVGPNGRVVEQVTTKKRQTQLDLNKEPAGTYLLHITIGDRSTVRKILKW